MTAATRSSAHALHAQSGQVLVLGMLLAGLLALALSRYFMVSQTAAHRARQLHALDAAAYSGALVQARAFNMLAYVNRSQVAHQVAMAHLVTLASWAKFGGEQAASVSRGNPPGYLVGMMFGPEHGAAYRASLRASGLRHLAQDHGALSDAYARHEALVHDVLTGVQDDVVGGLAQVRSEAVQEVLARNYPEHDTAPFRVTFDDDALPGYVQALRGNSGSSSSLRALVTQAVGFYRFLGNRDFTALNHWQVQPACPHLRHELRRRGATLLNSRGVWQSIDTQSFHALRFNRWVLCYYREYPMGWAWQAAGPSRFMSGTSVRSAVTSVSAQDFWRVARQTLAGGLLGQAGNPRANGRAVTQRRRWPAEGLPAYYDIRASRAAQALRFGLTLKRQGPDALDITTRSAAETFFDLPAPRRDGRTERPNLFSPYWQARLAPVQNSRR